MLNTSAECAREESQDHGPCFFFFFAKRNRGGLKLYSRRVDCERKEKRVEVCSLSRRGNPAPRTQLLRFEMLLIINARAKQEGEYLNKP